MTNFFQKDTFLIQKPSFSILREPKERICELCRRNENELLDKTNIIPLEEKVLVELTGARVKYGDCCGNPFSSSANVSRLNKYMVFINSTSAELTKFKR